MNKKRIISVISIIIVLVVSLFIYRVYSSKEDLGDQRNSIEAESTDNIKDVKCTEPTLIRIEVDSLSGKVEGYKDGIFIHGSSLESIKDNPYFVEGDNKGELVVEIVDDSYKVINSFKIKSGESKSHYAYLKKDKEYKVRISSNDFLGFYTCKMIKYTI